MNSPQFAVFLSYNTADAATVEWVALRLRQERIEAWLDRWNLTPGRPWQEEIVAGLRASRTCAVFIGPAGLGDWAREELGVAQDRATNDRDFRIFMVLLPDAPDLSDPSLAFLRMRTWVDLRQGLSADGIQNLIAAINGTPRQRDVPTEPGICPYRGLEAFDEEHARFFFGRDNDVALALEKLKSGRFLAVLGPSGSGKSSLVRAGVIPAVRRGALKGSETWTVRVFMPGSRPLTVLAAQLTRLFPTEAMQETLDGLRRDQRSLDLAVSLALAERPSEERLVLVVDQFEELFTLCRDDDERRAFLASLLYAAAIPGGRVVVVVGMRADFYHRCAPYPDLRTMLGEPLLVGPLDAAGLRQAIEEPAAQVGLQIEPGLTQTILASVIGRPGALPLLEHVLAQVWAQRQGTMLTLNAYIASGGVEGALEKRADAIYAEFTSGQKEIARQVLLRLVQPGENAEDTRRRADMTEVVGAFDDQEKVGAVVNALADQRLLTVGRDLEGNAVVEITHEALIRGWPLLREWVNEDREALRAHRRLTEAAQEWDRGGQIDGSLLYRGARLGAWQEQAAATGFGRRGGRGAGFTSVESAFLQASVVAQQTEQTERDAARVARERLMVERPLARAGEALFELDHSPERALLLVLAAAEEAPDASVVHRALFRVLSDSRIDRILHGHSDRVSSVAWHPNGPLILSGSYDGTARLWHADSGEHIGIAATHDAPITCVAWNHDGSLIATGGWDGRACIWDIDKRRVLRPLEGHENWVSSVSWSPSGRMLATGSLDNTARLWDVETGKTVQVLQGHTGWVRSVEWKPDGREVLTGSYDHTVGVWSVSSGKRILTLEGHEAAVPAVAWSEDGSQALSSSEDGTVRLWDLSQRRAITTLRVAASPVYDVKWAPHTRRVMTGGEDGIVRAWDIDSGTLTAEMAGHGGWVSGVSWDPDGNRAVSSSEDGTLRIVDMRPGFARIVGRHDGAVLSVCWHPTDCRAASAGKDGSARIWGAERGESGNDFALPGENVCQVAWSPDGLMLATGASTGAVALWDTATWSLMAERREHTDRVTRIAWSPEGNEFLTGGDDHTVRLWNAVTATAISTLEFGQGISGVAWNPVRRQALIAPWAETAFLWDIPVDPAQTSVLTPLKGHSTIVYAGAWSPDGSHALTTSGDGTARIWDAAAGVEIGKFRAGEAFSGDWNPKGHQVLTGSRDGIVRIWDIKSGADVVLLRHPNAVRAAQWNADATQIISGSDDGVVRVWAIDPTGALQQLRERVSRVLSEEEVRREIPQWHTQSRELLPGSEAADAP